MEIVTSVAELRRSVCAWRRQDARIGFVPTMGNLHAGHLALVAAAQAAATRTVVSIFVNPTQFGPTEDFARYPRTFAADCAQLAAAGVDLLFAPAVPEMYPDGAAMQTTVQVPALDGILCGAFRPGHFAGVATVVTKLFNIVGPDLAVFGEKDYQQLLIIKRLVRDLALPLTIAAVPTVREADGLALSSRNNFLTGAERGAATSVYRSLQSASQDLQNGNRDFPGIEQMRKKDLEQSGFVVDYFAIRDARDLGEPTDAAEDWVVLTAARLGRTRLIDNIAVHNPR